jgi:hypothetical protein
MYKPLGRLRPMGTAEEFMKYRLSFVATGVALLLAACASIPSGDSQCQPPAYCGYQKTYDYHGQG